MLFSMLPALFLAILAMLANPCSADVVQYIVYPVHGISPEGSKALESLLISLAGNEKLVYASTRFYQPTPAYWLAKLSEPASIEVENSPLVRDVRPNEQIVDVSSAMNLIKVNETFATNAASYETQLNPIATELVVISQPNVAGYYFDNFRNYVWKAASQETFIYHAELGINKAHEDFSSRPGRIEWLYTGLTKNMGLDQETEVIMKGGHSTCTASKAGGMIYGASKSATLVVVKMPDFSEGAIGEVLATILEDVMTKSRHGVSVISISWGTRYAEDLNFPIFDPWPGFYSDLEKLASQNVLVVCAAGNARQEHFRGRKRLWIDTYPAIFSPQVSKPHFRSSSLNLVAVSNCNVYGSQAPKSQAPMVDPLFAPGVDIKCAVSTAETGYRLDSGTSFSAPLVAGVIANLLASRDVQRFDNISNMIQGLTWKRRGGQSVIWDLVDVAHNPPEPGNAVGNFSLFNVTTATLQDRLTER